jgi:hypothetical protein
MATRRGRTGGKPTPGRKRGKETPDYYARAEGDEEFLQRARERVKLRARQQLWIRLGVLVVLAVLAYAIGPILYRVIRYQGEQTAEEFKGVGKHIREGVERRSGSEFEESSP